jgi:integrase/recombinase XerD
MTAVDRNVMAIETAIEIGIEMVIVGDRLRDVDRARHRDGIRHRPAGYRRSFSPRIAFLSRPRSAHMRRRAVRAESRFLVTRGDPNQTAHRIRSEDRVMASLVKLKDRRNWSITWFDTAGRRRIRSAGTSDKKLAERIAAKIEESELLAREGFVDPRAERFAIGARTPLLEHVEKFVKYLRDKGSTESHAKDRDAQLGRLLAAMKIDRVTQLTPAKVQGGLAELRRVRGLAACTLNRHLVAIKGLSRWLLREGLIASDPLTSLSKLNQEADRRHVRRALTPAEAAALIAAAERGPKVLGLEGRDRAMLYRLALGTGFRASELASLTPESFKLDGDTPVVIARAGYTKNRTEAVQPMRRDLAELLRAWLEGKAAGQPVFAVKSLHWRTWKMTKTDLEAAGIAAVDEDGRALDFHALRHTFITEVVRAGASVKEAQTLARHKTPELTFRVYAHARLHDLTKTLEAMPAATGVSSSRPVELPNEREAGVA